MSMEWAEFVYFLNFGPQEACEIEKIRRIA